jgi:hypothetical protein
MTATAWHESPHSHQKLENNGKHRKTSIDDQSAKYAFGSICYGIVGKARKRRETAYAALVRERSRVQSSLAAPAIQLNYRRFSCLNCVPRRRMRIKYLLAPFRNTRGEAASKSQIESRFIGVIGANPTGSLEGAGRSRPLYQAFLAELSSRSQSLYRRGGRGRLGLARNKRRLDRKRRGGPSS